MAAKSECTSRTGVCSRGRRADGGSPERLTWSETNAAEQPVPGNDSPRSWTPVTLGPDVPPPKGASSPGVRAGDLLFVSGQVPRDPRTGELVGVSIKKGSFDPEDTEDLEDLIVAAYRDAKAQADALASEKLGPLAGGLGEDLPGPGAPGGGQLGF